jgi:hypothetical protein
MFPISGTVYQPPPSGGGSTPPPDLSGYVTNGALTTALGNYSTTLLMNQAISTALVNNGISTGGVVNAVKDSNGLYDAPSFKNRIIIASPQEGWFGNSYALLRITAPATDADEYEFTVINTGSVPLRVMNLDNTNCHFVNGNTGTYVYGNVTTMNIPQRNAHLFIRVNDTHSGVVQLPGGAEEPGYDVCAIFEYQL